VKFVKQSRGLN